MGAAALTNARIGSDLLWVAVPALLSSIAVVGLSAGIAVYFGAAGTRAPVVLIGLALAWVVGMTVWSVTS